MNDITKLEENSKQVICIECLGTGYMKDSGYANMDKSHKCYTCNGTGCISIDRVKVSMEEYEKLYNEAIKTTWNHRKFQIL
jgi:DnaJ-class molecular chaperone